MKFIIYCTWVILQEQILSSQECSNNVIPICSSRIQWESTLDIKAKKIQISNWPHLASHFRKVLERSKWNLKLLSILHSADSGRLLDRWQFVYCSENGIQYRLYDRNINRDAIIKVHYHVQCSSPSRNNHFYFHFGRPTKCVSSFRITYWLRDRQTRNFAAWDLPWPSRKCEIMVHDQWTES